MELIETILTLLLTYLFAPTLMIKESCFSGVKGIYVINMKRVLHVLRFNIDFSGGQLEPYQARDKEIYTYQSQLFILCIFLIFQWGKFVYESWKLFN